MITSKIVKTVSVECWSCAVAAHAHRSKSAAESCIRKTSRKKAVEFVRWTNVELADVCEMIVMGDSLQIIAKRYGISSGRMIQVYKRGARKMLSIASITGNTIDDVDCSVASMRKHKQFWLEQIDGLRKAVNA